MTHLASVDLIAPFRRYKLQRCLPSPEYNEGRWYLSGFTPKNQNKAKQNKKIPNFHKSWPGYSDLNLSWTFVMLKLLYFHCLHPTECSTQLAEITVRLRGTPLMFAYCHSLMSMVPSSSVCSANDKIISTQNLSQHDLWIFFSITNSGFLERFWNWHLL